MHSIGNTSFFSVLDVGCGIFPKGNVNIDLFLNETKHRVKKQIINPKLIPNFIKADADNLPIKDNSFEIVCMHHVFEHLKNPKKALFEMLRVCTKEIIIVVPHRFAKKSLFRYKVCEAHKQIFTQTLLSDWLRSLKLSFEIEVKYKDLPHNFIPIIKLPHVLKVNIRK